MPQHCIQACHRVGHRNAEARPVLVRFLSRRFKEDICRLKYKLKGTKIFIREDLTRRRMALLKDLKSRYGFGKVWHKNGELFYKTGNVVNRFDCS